MINSNYKNRISLFIVAITLLPLTVEALLYPGNQLFYYLSYLFLGCLLFQAYLINYNKKIKFIFFSKHIFLYKYILFFSLILGLYVIGTNVSSLEEFILFRERYRNGLVSGTGIFLKPITSFISFYTGFMILKMKKPDYLVFSGIAVCVIFSFFLGLRIFLFPIALGFFIRIIISWKLTKVFYSTFLVLFLLLGSKILINQDSNLQDVLLSQISRTNYRSMVNHDGIDSTNNLFCVIKPFNYLMGCDVSIFKEYFFKQQTKSTIFQDMEYVHKYTGVAIPINLYFFNNYGLGVIVSSLILLLFLFFFMQLTISSNNLSAFYFSLTIIILGSLLEDVNFLNKYIEFIPISAIIGFNKLKL